MEILNLSWYAVGKVLLGVGFAYLMAPLLLVLRSYLLFKVIEKYLLNSSLHFEIDICESDRWYLANKYQKKRNIKIPVSGGETIYELDGEQVTREQYESYESGLNMHQSRFHLLDAKINSRQNLIFWLTNHYKQDGFKSPIPEWRQEAYDRREMENA